MERVVFKLVVLLLMLVVVVSCASNATTTPAPKSTTPKPSKTPGILEDIETFIAAIPVGIATACQTGAKAVVNFFTNPWW